MSEGHSESAAEPQGPTLLPMRFLGMGLWIVWQWATHWDVTLFLPGCADAGVAFTVCDLAMRLVDVPAMVVVALLWRRLTPLARHRWLFAVAGACTCLGTAGMLACLNGLVASEPLAAAFSALAAFGGAVLFLSWAEVYSRLAPDRMMFMGMLSLILAGCVSFVLNCLRPPLPVAGTVVVPALSFLLCAAAQRFAFSAGSPDPVPAAHVSYAFPWKPVAVMAFAGFVAGFGNFTLFNQTSNTRMLATFVVGVVVLCVSWLAGGRVRLGHFAWGAFGTSLVGFVLVAVMGASYPTPAAFLIMLAYIALCVVGLSLLGRLSFKGEIPSLWLFGLGRAASELMMGLGSYAHFVPGVEGMPQDGYSLAVMSVVGIVCLILVALLWKSEDAEASNWAVSMLDADSGRRVESERDRLVAGCTAMSRAAGLTEREREVLELLVLGQSYQQVCQSLLLSMGTVKTHVRHIYGKLDVHSREQAVELALRSS